jgi:hypothetical protein
LLRNCSEIAQKRKSCFKLLELKKVAPNAKSCSKVAEHNRTMPSPYSCLNSTWLQVQQGRQPEIQKQYTVMSLHCKFLFDYALQKNRNGSFQKRSIPPPTEEIENTPPPPPLRTSLNGSSSPPSPDVKAQSYPLPFGHPLFLNFSKGYLAVSLLRKHLTRGIGWWEIVC